MPVPRSLSVPLLALALACCQGGPTAGRDAPTPTPAPDPDPVPEPTPALSPTPNPERDITHTDLVLDVTAHEGTAHITFASGGLGATLDADGLDLKTVLFEGAPLAHELDGELLHLALPASTEPLVVEIRYDYRLRDKAEGAFQDLSLTWPYFCDRLFPCHTNPADGLRFRARLEGLPEGHTAIVPASIEQDAPPYMFAFTHGAYASLELGTTSAGTKVRAQFPESIREDATEGTEHLVAAFDYLERTYGPYLYGREVATVSVQWSAGAYGGMEHHPYWHVAEGAFADPVVHVHEAAHGWYGNGVRIACWEDFVLSESLASYLAARALEGAAGEQMGQQVWADYRKRLERLGDGPRAASGWPEGCGTHDVLEDGIFSTAPYMRGAFFWRAVERKVGREALDASLRGFYLDHRGQAARFEELLGRVADDTGYDPKPCAEAWLRSETRPANETCD